MKQQQALEVLLQLGETLEQIHTCEVIHSDIKPEKVIYTGQGQFVLLDFGVSRRQSPGRISKLAIVAVSPGYSPPEQYLGSKHLTPATDIYSLAATIYTLLSLTVPPEATLRANGTSPQVAARAELDRYSCVLGRYRGRSGPRPSQASSID